MSARLGGLLLAFGVLASGAPLAHSPLDTLLEKLGELTGGDADAGAEEDAGPPGPATIDFQGELDELSGPSWRRKLAEVRDAPTIHVRINTPGGDVDQMILTSQALEDAGAKVTCVVDGEAASAGFFLLQSCARREMTRRAVLMAHEPYTRLTDRATKDQLAGTASHIDALIVQYSEHCAARLKISAAELRKRIRGEDWWIAPDEARAIGAVDAVIPSPNTPRPMLPDAGQVDGGRAD